MSRASLAIGQSRSRRDQTSSGCAGACRARAQDPFEGRRVVRVRELAGARQVQVVEPRQPEAQRGGAQQRRPLHAFIVGQRPHARRRRATIAFMRASSRLPSTLPATHQSLTAIARS